MSFEVSVVIPVYNAERYLEKAVQSALQQPEVGEVILVEDKSPDRSLNVCQELVAAHDRVKLYRHPNGENRGAGASRNLGIEKAMFSFIAFLDADDFFLANRFKKTKEVFDDHPDADGVYDAIGYFKDGDEGNYKLFTISKPLQPGLLFHYLLRGTYGHFSTIGVTVKKSLFKTTGLFNIHLKLHQDTEMWLRMAHFSKLFPGELNKPVALARKHDLNRITAANYRSKLQYWELVKRYYRDKRIGMVNRLLIDRKIARLRSAGEQRSFLITLMSEWMK